MSEVKLPDFDDMVSLAEEIKLLSVAKAVSTTKLDEEIAGVILKVKKDESYYENGKPPAMSLIDKTYAITGLNGELLSLRITIAEISADLASKKLLFQLYRDMIDVWRTESANKRYTVQ